MRIGIPHGVVTVLHRHHRGGLFGVAQRVHAGAPVRSRKSHDADREFAPPEGVVERRYRVLQRALRQFIVGDDEHAVHESAGNLVVAGQHAGKSRSASARDPHDGLQRSPDRIDHPFLGLVDGGEQHRSRRHHDGINVLDGQVRIVERTVHRLAHQPRLTDVGAPARVVRLADSDDSHMTAHVHTSSVTTQCVCMPMPPAA